MEKMDLSKKVLASLLTMSCVYLGGHPRSRWQRGGHGFTDFLCEIGFEL